MKNYKYLDDLGIHKKDQYQNWFDETIGDRREKEWEEQRDKYGIDERETWNWNEEFMDYCYIHLKMYNKVNKVDLTYHKITYEGTEMTVQEAIDKILEWFEKEYYPDRGDLLSTDKPYDQIVEEHLAYVKTYEYTMHLLVDIMPYLWW